jgi:hypothetical protein
MRVPGGPRARREADELTSRASQVAARELPFDGDGAREEVGEAVWRRLRPPADLSTCPSSMGLRYRQQRFGKTGTVNLNSGCAYFDLLTVRFR